MKIVAAMSGGVDSSVAALKLVRAGHDVTGVFFRLVDPLGEGGSRCCSPRDREDAHRAAERLGIELDEECLSRRFFDEVFEASLSAYARGLTPNPCVICNRKIKFAELVHVADELGADRVATGHFARVERSGDGTAHLLRAADRSKDQSYFLHRIGQDVLSRTLFPVGGMSKEEVRELARAAGLAQAEKAESQELCFVPEGTSYADLVESWVPDLIRPGAIVDRDGRRRGEHGGIHRFTIGQRRGLGISSDAPLYVVELDSETATVVVGGPDDLLRTRIRAYDLTWVAGEPPSDVFTCTVQVRSRHRGTPAEVRVQGGTADIELAEPVRAPAPGQAAVLYNGDEVLGGGWIAGPHR
ncbi:MAG: tRNA 2-thiouridine(34) synthase MnmA [Acidobacteria bacterium]|nr:tRNA 2-thiouridine(34) synthase MnmA [Acidobacteriota bacterium]